MIAYLILGIALLIGFILLSRWFVNADVKQVATALKIIAGVFGVLFLAYLLISGRWTLLPALLFVALPWINRLRGALGGIRARPSAGQASDLETRFLRMHLDHDSGEMDGEVRDGAFRGRKLAEMSLDELIALLDECFRQDAQSARVLESYLDRVHGADWRALARQAGPAGGDGPMSRAEAYQILDLEPGAGAREIKEAYHRLIGRMHPDQGGSTYLAAKLNQARDTLLGA